MKISTKLAVAVALAAVVLIGARAPSATVSTAKMPAPTPTPWPDLTTLKKFNNPKGKTCGIDGAATPGSEKARLNDLKNRFRLPTGEFESITFDDLLALNQGHIKGKKIIGFPDSNDANNQRAVSVVGFVQSVFAAGCTKHTTSQGESCNCNTIDKRLCDAHINVLPEKGINSAGGRNTYVVEVTERSRRLAALGLLPSNIGNDWSTPTLMTKLKGRVRFSGFLFFDTDHSGQAWVSDPKDKVHAGTKGDNFRQTAWEVHPVMGIEVLH